MNPPIDLTPEQKRFLAHACAFIGTNPPPRHELDKLSTLAAMVLPGPVTEMLRTRIVNTGKSPRG